MKTFSALLLITIVISLKAQTTSSWSTGGNVDYEVKHDVIDKPWAIINSWRKRWIDQ
ncbi:MAG: hypothetical protein AAGF85_01470 [Bacteroidota bacterium]